MHRQKKSVMCIKRESPQTKKDYFNQTNKCCTVTENKRDLAANVLRSKELSLLFFWYKRDQCTVSCLEITKQTRNWSIQFSWPWLFWRWFHSNTSHWKPVIGAMAAAVAVATIVFVVVFFCSYCYWCYFFVNKKAHSFFSLSFSPDSSYSFLCHIKLQLFCILLLISFDRT